MGLFDKITSVIVPAAVGFATGGPAGAFAGAVSGAEAEKAQRRQQRLIEQQVEQQRKQQMADPYLTSYLPSSSTSNVPPTTANAGFGAGFGSFLSDVGRNILNPLGNIFGSPAIRPFISQQSATQPAVPTLSTAGGQESSESGARTAFVGGLPNIVGQVARFLRSTPGQIGTGLAIGAGSSLMSDSGQKIRITRKMKSQYRSILNLNMGNYELAADMIGVSVDFFIMVLLKRFRNDGPVVTKAALRKTKTTVRRLKNMCDMYDSLKPTATRRKAPMRRASTTLISNK